VVTKDEIELTEEELRATRARGDKMVFLMAIGGMLALALFAVPCAALGGSLVDGAARWPVTGLIASIIGLPVVIWTNRASAKQNAATAAVMDELRTELRAALAEAEAQASFREAQSTQQEFESRLANALEMAEGEPEVIDVVKRAFDVTLPGAPVELLLADNSHAHLSRMTHTAAAEDAMCGVDSPHQCPAARRAQVQHFPDSEALDACPKLRGRAAGACSAICVPVSIMGRTVGVIHATAARHATVEDARVHGVATLAKLAGARIGLLRMVADTQLQAATDSLTGLLNRRSLEHRCRELGGEAGPFAAVMADLDHFKQVNDTYGHETGDRALRLFAQTLSSALRPVDLVCRHGGEEFAVVLPGCTAHEAARALEGVQRAMEVAVVAAGLPAVTASYGVVEVAHVDELAAVLSRADAALFQAKREGRDRIVVHGGAGSPAPAVLESLTVVR
jgi:diguanylate cyclase (GGDEF)-like protein